MDKMRDKLGLTMAEVLIVIAIIAVLGGVSFISVNRYQRSLGQLERDGIAKQIFIAAQNHLTAAFGEGYLGITEYGTEGTATGDSDKGVYYYIVNKGRVSSGGQNMFDLMLPFGSIDETIRLGGSYLIRYQPKTGTVMDVFYCSSPETASPEQFNYALGTNADDYTTVVGLRDTELENHKPDRRDWDKRILGWLGGAEAASIPNTTLNAPTLEVTNGAKLYATITNTNSGNPNAYLKLIVSGKESKAQKAFDLQAGGRIINWGNTFTVFLDDITSTGMHFADIHADTTVQFIPGEDITIQAVAYSDVLAKPAFSAKQTTNSLFDSIGSSNDKAYIANIRHLENLDKKISKLNENINSAEQVNNIGWIDFKKENKKIESKSTTGTASAEGYNLVKIIKADTSSNPASTEEGYYMPVNPDYDLSYNGRSFKISDVAIKWNGDAGLFGLPDKKIVISNLELIDFAVEGSTSAGALVGSLSSADADSAVSNVLVRNSSDGDLLFDNDDRTNNKKPNVYATGTAGGLIGNSGAFSITDCAAAVYVKGNTTAGGLIGSANGRISGCYSGGHAETLNGSSAKNIAYSDKNYNVIGATAGGLIGSANTSTISNCYSTCSVSGTTVGGFVGSSNGSISNTYCTGLVSGNNTYIGTYGNQLSFSGENYFYEAVNERTTRDAGNNITGISYLTSGHSNVTAFDVDTATYDAFIRSDSEWGIADAYNTDLRKYYSGKYNLPTVKRLGAAERTDVNKDFTAIHYGDWPSPEIFIINTAS